MRRGRTATRSGSLAPVFPEDRRGRRWSPPAQAATVSRAAPAVPRLAVAAVTTCARPGRCGRAGVVHGRHDQERGAINANQGGVAGGTHRIRLRHRRRAGVPSHPGWRAQPRGRRYPGLCGVLTGAGRIPGQWAAGGPITPSRPASASAAAVRGAAYWRCRERPDSPAGRPGAPIATWPDPGTRPGRKSRNVRAGLPVRIGQSVRTGRMIGRRRVAFLLPSAFSRSLASSQ